MEKGLDIYNALKQPPKDALRTIQAGRLKGKTDINPQWRYKAMTEQFGVCGVGWKYNIARVWNEPVEDGQVFAFAEINLYIKDGDKWSDAIPATGGSMLVAKESSGLHANDEGYKMAITDAIGTAMKMLGVAADIYAGLWDGTNYMDAEGAMSRQTPKEKPKDPKLALLQRLARSAKANGYSNEQLSAFLPVKFGVKTSKELTEEQIMELTVIVEGKLPLEVKTTELQAELTEKGGE